MKFLTYWAESIKMLRWSEFKVLLIDSVKTFGKSLVLMAKYFWWLFVLAIGGEYFADWLLFINKAFYEDLLKKIIPNFAINIDIFIAIFTLFVFIFAFMLLFIETFIRYLTTRPTNETKNFSYYLKYSKIFGKSFKIFILEMIIFFISSVIFVIILKLFGYNPSPNSYILRLILLSCFVVFDNLSQFFFFDSNEKVIASVRRGFTLFFYFFPLCIVLQIPLIISHLLRALFNHQELLTHSFFESFIAVILRPLLASIVGLISASTTAMLYAKIKDKYPELFSITNQK